jgi:RHH-type proline utilization regulon transcriptional repressor/proline dehydrogenase/delta 1-pyrroline-5-carboxylate dehydrogenase
MDIGVLWTENGKIMEERILEIGAELFSALGEETPSLFDQRRWKGRITRWAMKDEAFKTQLFRFVDVLPALKSDELVVRLFREYFEGFEDAPFLIRQGLKRVISRFPSASASLIRSAVGSLARQFIAGNDPRDALPYLESLVEDGADLSVDLLGETVLSDAEAHRYGARYLELLDFFQPHFRRIDISLKVTSFYSQLEPLNWKGSLPSTRSWNPSTGKAPSKRHGKASCRYSRRPGHREPLSPSTWSTITSRTSPSPSSGALSMNFGISQVRESPCRPT